MSLCQIAGVLNITNGDSAVGIMQEARIPGVYLPWRDVLHEGPVPDGLSLKELSELRAEFLSQKGLGSHEHIRQAFIDRDDALMSSGSFKKIILWFEHDLYDQLQLLQVLDWFNQNRPAETELSIICVDQYLGVQSPAQMRDLLQYEVHVSQQQLTLSSKAWSAFRSSTPEMWRDLLNADTSVLPFLEGAITRLLEEYPDCNTGLSRTARHAVEIVRSGEGQPGRVFARYQETEERRFLGDSSFWAILEELTSSAQPLLQLPEGLELTMPAKPDQILSVTSLGHEVLFGKRNWLEIDGLDRWIGGAHLTHANTWCWDSKLGSLARIPLASISI
jgi:hypothetical protein